jgi:hypothetical protein
VAQAVIHPTRPRVVLAVLVAIAVVATAVFIQMATAADVSVPPAPVPGIKSINSHPIGTVGSATEAVGGMVLGCRLPSGHAPVPGDTTAQVQALCAAYGTH